MAEQLTKRKLYSSFSWSFLDQFFSYGISILVQIVVARILDPTAYGIIAIVLIFVNLANVLAMSGFASALIQKQDADERDYTSAFWVSELFALILYGVIFLAAPLISDYYEIQELTIYIRVFAIVLFFTSYNAIQRAYLQKLFDFKHGFIVSLTAAIISGIVGIALALLQFGVWAIVAQTLASSVVLCLMFMIYVPWKPSLRFSLRRALDLFSFGWKLAVTGLINTLSDSLIDTIVGKSVSVTSLGFYTQGRRYPSVVASLVQAPLSNVLFPAFALIQENPDEIRGLMKRGLQVGSFLVAPLLFFFALIGDPLVSLLLTDKWLPCVPVMQAFCLIYSCLIVETMNLRVYTALKRSDVYLYLHIGRAVLSIAVSAVAVIVSHSIYVLALSFAVTQTLYILFVETHPAKKLCGYSPLRQLKDVALIYVASVVALVACLPLLSFGWNPILEIVLLAIAFFALYLILSILFRLPGLQFAVSEILNFMKGRLNRR